MSAALSPRKQRRQARKARRAARHEAAAVVLPPEGVPINLPIASVGVRVAAQLSDVLVTVVAAVCLIIFLTFLDILEPQTTFAVAMLIFFLIRVPYYVLAELAWNGQTLGKKWMKIKVVAHDGRSLSTHALVLRNLMKEAEVFLPGTLLFTLNSATPIYTLMAFSWIVMALTIPLMNPHRQRLGDFMAGTHVVHLPQPILLKDLASDAPPSRPAKPEGFTFLAHHLDHYGAFELQTLETVLRAQENPVGREAQARARETLVAIVQKIRTKINYADPVPPEEAVAFLRAFYNAQRAHLEQRQLFGDKRADKHHSAAARAQQADQSTSE